MKIKFWGTRGSIAISGHAFQKYGGNTTCLEITHGQHRIIVDAGTGIRGLGELMLKRNDLRHTSLFFTHLHWDHVQGFPFFTPAYLPTRAFDIFGPGNEGALAVQNCLRQQMSEPFFPVAFDALKSRLHFESIIPSERISTGPFSVTAFWVNHPQGCAGYRIEAAGRSVVFVTDAELASETLSPGIRQFAACADVLILDAQYTLDEYETKRGWGHTHNMNAARIAHVLHAKRLCLIHHDPTHDDAFVDEMESEAQALFSNSCAAREGQMISLGDEPAAVPFATENNDALDEAQFGTPSCSS